MSRQAKTPSHSFRDDRGRHWRLRFDPGAIARLREIGFSFEDFKDERDWLKFAQSTEGAKRSVDAMYAILKPTIEQRKLDEVEFAAGLANCWPEAMMAMVGAWLELAKSRRNMKRAARAFTK